MEKYRSNLMLCLSGAIMILSVFMGCIRVSSLAEGDMASVNEYMNSFFRQVPEINPQLFWGSLGEYAVIWLVIALSGALMPLFLINLFMVFKRGYVIGYTLGAFLCVYGGKGLLCCGGLFPELFLFIPILTVFSSFSLKMAFFSRENKKAFLRKYVILCLIFLSVFCAFSFVQTFLTTTFMKIISHLM